MFLELIIDPACSVVFESEPEEADVMSRKPRSVDNKLFNRNAALVSFLQGFGVLIAVVVVFISSLNSGFGEDGARAMAFATIVFGNLALILTNRSWSQTIIGAFRKRNNAVVWVFGGAILALVFVLYVPLLRDLFLFSAVQPADLLMCLVAGFVSVVWFELFKFFRKK
jgi:Ca2+-transporting ATPase